LSHRQGRQASAGKELVDGKQRGTNMTVSEELQSSSGVKFHLDRKKGKERKQGKRVKTTKEGNRESVTVTGAVATGSCKD
jgi:hypothetical protein